MNFSKLSILFLLFASCKLTEKNIAGEYNHYSNFEASAKLTLRSDKTFDYFFQSGIIFTYRGKWRLSKDTLILYSNIKPVVQKSLITQVSVSSDIWIKIFVNDDLINPVPLQYYKNGNKNIVFDTLQIPYTDIKDTFNIYPFPFSPVVLKKYEIKPGLLQIKVFKNSYDYFDDMKFLTNNGKLRELFKQKKTGLVLRPSSPLQ